MKKDYTYAVARIRGREMSLFGQPVIPLRRERHCCNKTDVRHWTLPHVFCFAQEQTACRQKKTDGLVTRR